MNDIPAIVVAAGLYLEHCRYVQYPSEREYAEVVALSTKEAVTQAAALEVLQLYFTEERAYNEPYEDDDTMDWPTHDPETGPVMLLAEETKEKERDERPTNQPRLEDRPD